MNDTSPFVIQFPSLDDFIAEMAVADIGLARVWLGQFGTGGSPGTRYHAVMVQAIDAPQHTILQTTLIIGSYQTLYDTPFGPTNEAAARIIQERQKQALSDVQAYLVGKLPAIALRPGHIHTGLDGTKISRTYWDGFNPIYEELKQARKGGSMSKQAVGNGIVRKDGRWVMLCGGREPVPIRLLDAQNREIEPNRAETKTAESHTSTVQETAE